MSTNLTSEPKLDLVQVRRIRSMRPAPENNEVYNAIASDNPDLIELANSIRDHGVQDPLLISTDGYIISGHRRRAAALLAGLTEVPVRIHPISRADDPAASGRNEFAAG
jgi:ParB-like chromosome segregation protein Spo0J